jgi:hypothetical protein
MTRMAAAVAVLLAILEQSQAQCMGPPFFEKYAANTVCAADDTINTQALCEMAFDCLGQVRYARTVATYAAKASTPGGCSIKPTAMTTLYWNAYLTDGAAATDYAPICIKNVTTVTTTTTVAGNSTTATTATTGGNSTTATTAATTATTGALVSAVSPTSPSALFMGLISAVVLVRMRM